MGGCRAIWLIRRCESICIWFDFFAGELLWAGMVGGGIMGWWGMIWHLGLGLPCVGGNGLAFGLGGAVGWWE